jgi:hypothetical protein
VAWNRLRCVFVHSTISVIVDDTQIPVAA